MRCGLLHGQDQLATHKDPLQVKILEPQPPILGFLLTWPAARGFHLTNMHVSRDGGGPWWHVWNKSYALGPFHGEALLCQGTKIVQRMVIVSVTKPANGTRKSKAPQFFPQHQSQVPSYSIACHIEIVHRKEHVTLAGLSNHVDVPPLRFETANPS